MARTIYRGNDFDILHDGLALAANGVEISTATLAWTLYSPSDVQLGTGPLTWNATTGQYEGVVESSVFVSQPLNVNLKLRITAVDGARNGEWWDDKCVVKLRPFEV